MSDILPFQEKYCTQYDYSDRKAMYFIIRFLRLKIWAILIFSAAVGLALELGLIVCLSL